MVKVQDKPPDGFLDAPPDGFSDTPPDGFAENMGAPLRLKSVLPEIKDMGKAVFSGPHGMAVYAGIKGKKVFEKLTAPIEQKVENVRQNVSDIISFPREEIFKKAEQTGKVDYPKVISRTAAETLTNLTIPGPKELALIAGPAAISKIMKPISALPPTKLSPAVTKIMQALKEAAPIRKEQEAIYSAIRSRQAGEIVGVGQSVPGEAGYFAQLSKLKGTMPKVQFEGIRTKLEQPDIDELFNTVEQSKVISPFEKISAKTGLSKLLGVEGGAVPTKGELSLLSEVFPKEFVQSVLAKRPTMEKVWSATKNVLNLPRAMMSTVDLSAPLRQGAFLIGRPKQWGTAFKEMFKYAWDEKAYQGLLDNIKSRPTYPLMRESKLDITELGPVLEKREEAFMSNISERIPGFGRIARGSNRAYSGFLNKLRADVFDDLYSKADSFGLTKDNPKLVNDIAKFVNSATGRGDIGSLNKSAEVLNGVFFSPKLMFSRINLMNPAYYIKLDPFVRKEALKSLLAFTGAGTTVATMAKLGGADVGTDPRSSDFGKIKVGNTRYDLWGGFQQYIVLGSRLITNKMISSTTGKEFVFGEGYKATTRLDAIQRFFESKTAPIASFTLGLLRGKNSIGEEFDVPKEVLQRFTPMVLQDMADLVEDRGPQAIPMMAPAIFGMGAQTYGPKQTGPAMPALPPIPKRPKMPERPKR